MRCGFGNGMIRFSAVVLMGFGLLSGPASAESPAGFSDMLKTAVASNSQASFNAILDTALATWPNKRKEILAAAHAMQPSWLIPAHVQEAERNIAAKRAAEKASRDRGIIYYLDPSLWNGQAEMGAGTSTGDTDEQAVSMGLSFNRNFGPKWEHALDLDFDFARSEGNTTRQSFVTKYETLWRAWDKTYFANYIELETTRFSGYSYRVIENLGIGYQLIKNDRQSLRLEAGPGVRFSKLTEDSETTMQGDLTKTEFLGRLATTYDLKLSERTSIRNRAALILEAETSIENLTEFSARINTHLAARVSLEVKYDSGAPLGTSVWDTITRATLVYDF